MSVEKLQTTEKAIGNNLVLKRILNERKMKLDWHAEHGEWKSHIITESLFSPWDIVAYRIAQEVADKHGVSLKLHNMALHAEDEAPDYAYVFSAKIESTRGATFIIDNLLEAQNEFEGGVKRLVDIALQKRTE